MDEHDEVRVLLDRAGFAKVTHHGLFVGALFVSAVELRNRDHGNLDLLREELERTREFRNLLLARLDALTGAHELQVVDHDQFEIRLLLEATALRANLHEGHVRRIVDIQRRIHEASRGARKALPVLIVDRAVAKATHRHLRFGGHDAHHDLLAVHFEGEDGRRHPVVDRGAPHHVHAERGLTHRGAAREDDHLAGVQALREFVELRESRGHAVDLPAARLEHLDEVHRRLNHFGKLHVVLGLRAVRDRVHLRLRLVDGGINLAAIRGETKLHDARARLNEATERSPLRDDFGIEPRVGSRRNRIDQIGEVRGSTDLLEVALLTQRIGDRHEVGRLPATVKVDDRLVNEFVRGAVKVVAAELLDDVGDRILRQHHAAQNALLST